MKQREGDIVMTFQVKAWMDQVVMRNGRVQHSIWNLCRGERWRCLWPYSEDEEDEHDKEDKEEDDEEEDEDKA